VEKKKKTGFLTYGQQIIGVWVEKNLETLKKKTLTNKIVQRLFFFSPSLQPG